MWTRMIFLLSLALVFGLSTSGVVLGASPEAKEIEQMLICPACTDTGMTVDYCPDSTAEGIRRDVETKLAAGETKEQIINEFLAQYPQYGKTLLAKPETKGFALGAWVMPFAGVLFGIILVWLILRRRPQTRGARQEQTFDGQEFASQLDAEIKKYL